MRHRYQLPRAALRESQGNLSLIRWSGRCQASRTERAICGAFLTFRRSVLPIDLDLASTCIFARNVGLQEQERSFYEELEPLSMFTAGGGHARVVPVVRRGHTRGAGADL